jgi:hypothetical protein
MVRYNMIETDSLERLFGNLRMALTGGHGDVFQALCALSIAAFGSFDFLNSEMYKTNSPQTEANMLSNMFDQNF